MRFVELHGVWLLDEYRGKGYGERFLSFLKSTCELRVMRGLFFMRIIRQLWLFAASEDTRKAVL